MPSAQVPAGTALWMGVRDGALSKSSLPDGYFCREGHKGRCCRVMLHIGLCNLVPSRGPLQLSIVIANGKGSGVRHAIILHSTVKGQSEEEIMINP